MEKNKNLISIEIKTKLSKNEEESINKIGEENSYQNGGKLFYAGIQPFDYVCLAKKDSDVIGFSFLLKSFLSKNDLYILQSAINKNYQNLGVSNALYNYIYSHSKDFDCITCGVLSNDKSSYKFYENQGFVLMPNTTDFGFYLMKNSNKESLSINNAKPKTYQLFNFKNLKNENQELEK